MSIPPPQRRRALSVDVNSDVPLETHADFLSSSTYNLLRTQHVPAKPMDQPSYSVRHVSCESVVFNTWEQIRNDDHPTDWLVATVDKHRIIRLKGSGTNEGLDGVLRCLDDDDIYFGAIRVTVRAGKRIKLLRVVITGLNVTEDQKQKKMVFKNYIFNSFHGSHGEVLIPNGSDHLEYELTRHITALTGTDKWWIGTHIPSWYLPHPLDEDKHNPDDDFYENEQGTILPKPKVLIDPTYIEPLKNPADILREQHWDWTKEQFDSDGTPLGSPVQTPGGPSSFRLDPSRYPSSFSRVHSEANSEEGSHISSPVASRYNSEIFTASKSGRMTSNLIGNAIASSSSLDIDNMSDQKDDGKEDNNSNSSSPSENAPTSRKVGISAGTSFRTWPLDISTRKLSIKEEGPMGSKYDDDSCHDMPPDIDDMTPSSSNDIYRASSKENTMRASQKGTYDLMEGK